MGNRTVSFIIAAIVKIQQIHIPYCVERKIISKWIDFPRNGTFCNIIFFSFFSFEMFKSHRVKTVNVYWLIPNQ